MARLNTYNVSINGRKTSVKLEVHMWASLEEIAKREKTSVNELCTLIYKNHDKNTGFTSSLRVFILLYFKAASTEKGHNSAGHGSIRNMIDRAKNANKNVSGAGSSRQVESEYLR